VTQAASSERTPSFFRGVFLHVCRRTLEASDDTVIGATLGVNPDRVFEQDTSHLFWHGRGRVPHRPRSSRRGEGHEFSSSFFSAHLRQFLFYLFFPF